MRLFPAIDILDGRAVRLMYGKKEQVTDYGDPVERAKMWIDCGAQILHVVDLSGAFGESTAFERTLEKIARLGIEVQSGGGLRSMEQIVKRFEAGASRAVLGTVCVERTDVLQEAVERYGERIVAGIDAKEGKIAVRGWTEVSQTDAFEFGKKAFEMGVSDTVFTDIGRDGALSGVNAEATAKMGKTGLNVIASGGIKDMNDLYALRDRGVYGAILGRAIYTGNIDLARAVGELQC